MCEYFLNKDLFGPLYVWYRQRLKKNLSHQFHPQIHHSKTLENNIKKSIESIVVVLKSNHYIIKILYSKNVADTEYKFSNYLLHC